MTDNTDGQTKIQACRILLCFLVLGFGPALEASQSFVDYKIIERIPFEAFTSTEATEAVLYIGTSKEKGEHFLSVVYSYGLEAPLHVVAELRHAHSPLIGTKEDLILILFTAGANTTCVAKIVIEEGTPKHLSTEAIAWNDSGVYRTSDSFSTYEHLLEKRKHNQAEVATP